MPNIMLTYKCNLKCSYCFANEFVNKSNTDISLENFDKAVEFMTRSGASSIGLIGGEPTIHPQFKEIMRRLILNKKIQDITVYTNGILLDKYFSELVNPKVRILVNCNAPEIIGENAYNRITDNIDTLINTYYMKDRINVGINLYSNEMDYSYMLELLQRFELHRVRISVTVPDFSCCGDVDVLDYFKSRKKFLLEFFAKMDEIQVLPYYDCNKPPYCVWDEKEKEWLKSYVSKYPVSESNLIGNCSQCFPVIDILPDLKAVRCFGMSDYEKVNISDFKTMTDIASYFINQIDTHVYKISTGNECRECYERKSRHCTAGCIGFKAAQITKCNQFYDYFD